MARKPAKPKAPQGGLRFTALVEAVRQVHEHSAAAASRAVNTSLTLRNWAIGCYIVEYEQSGADRAEYGERMMDRLAEELRRRGVPASDRQRLYAYVGFYRAYPQIGEAIPPAWAAHGLSAPPTRPSAIVRSLTGQSAETAKPKDIVRSATGISQTSGRILADRLSYTHLELLTGLEEPLKRAFYEIECIRGNWSVSAASRGANRRRYSTTFCARRCPPRRVQGAEASSPSLKLSLAETVSGSGTVLLESCVINRATSSWPITTRNHRSRSDITWYCRSSAVPAK